MTSNNDNVASRIAEFRAKVLALLNSDWPPCAETDPDTMDRASVLAKQLRDWESWGKIKPSEVQK